MSEAAAQSTSVNPNIPVGPEATASSKANSSISFDEVSDVQEASRPAPSKPRIVKDEDKGAKKAPPTGKAKGESTEFGEPDEKPTAQAKPEKDAAPADGKAPKPKLHKVKVGESTYDIPGNTPMEVKVNGEMTTVEFQELLNNYSGSLHIRQEHAKLVKQQKEFTTQREGLTKMASDLYERAQKDPDAAFDFLADMTKQDPVKLKMDILRKQFDHFKPLFDMPEAEREAWFKDRERDFRDATHARRDAADKEREAKTVEDTKRSQAAEQFGIDEQRWDAAKDLAERYLKKVDPNFGGKATTEQVIWADRNLLALDVIAETVPHLEKNEKFDSIVGDIVQDLVAHPELTREKLAKLLVEVYGAEGSKDQARLARKAAKNAEQDEDKPRATVRSSSSDPLNFDDLEA